METFTPSTSSSINNTHILNVFEILNKQSTIVSPQILQTSFASLPIAKNDNFIYLTRKRQKVNKLDYGQVWIGLV